MVGVLSYYTKFICLNNNLFLYSFTYRCKQMLLCKILKFVNIKGYYFFETEPFWQLNSTIEKEKIAGYPHTLQEN